MGAWDNNSNTYSVGNWYTWAAAVASTSYYSTNNQTIADTSICPANWHLPTGGNKNNTSNSEFWQLIVNGIVGEEPANMSSETYPYYTTGTEGANASKLIRAYPNNFIYSGFFADSSPSSRGGHGYYWSSSVYSGGYSYQFRLTGSIINPGTYYYDGAAKGCSVRCLIGS